MDLEQVYNQIPDDAKDDIVMEIVEWAWIIFNTAGCQNDFCIQSHKWPMVFGSTNRLIFGRFGFSIDRRCCTEKFLYYWDNSEYAK